MQDDRPNVLVPFRGSSDVPRTESEFLEMVYRCEFERLTDQFSSGRLTKFESHAFMERVVQHALLAEDDRRITVDNGREGNFFWVSFAAAWPTNPLVNVALWRIVDARGSVKDGVVERRASSGRLSESIRVGATSRADIQVVFAIKSPSGTIAASHNLHRTRVTFEVPDEFDDEVDVLDPEEFEITRYQHSPKKRLLTRLPQMIGISIVVGVIVWRVSEWL